MSQIGSLHHDSRQTCTCEIIIIKKIGVGPFYNLLRQISIADKLLYTELCMDSLVADDYRMSMDV